MAVTIGDVTIRIGASTKTLNSDLRKAERSLQASAAKFKTIGTNLSLSLTAPFAALAGVAVINYDKQIQAIGQVETALRTTGAASGKTSEELQKLASSLQEVTTFGDEEILQKSTAQLLTFTNIAGDVFDKAQLQALNLSQRLGIDLQQASIQLGKALNDPIQGINALRRSGVSFSDEQKALIKTLVDTGQTVKAQELILGELEKQYGGSAEAAAKLGLGPLKQLQNLVGDLTEEFGVVISEALIPFVKSLTNIVKSYQNLDEGTKKLIIKIAGVLAVIGPAVLIFGQVAFAVGKLQLAWVGLTTAFAAGGIKSAFAFLGGPAILIVGAVAAAIYLIYKNWETVKKSMVDVANYFVDLYNESIIFRGAVNSVVAIFKNIAAGAKLAFNIMLSGVELVGKAFIGTFKTIGSLIKSVLTGDFGAIKGIIKDAFAGGFSNVGTFLDQASNELAIFNTTALLNTQEAIDKTFNPRPLKQFGLEVDEVSKKVDDLNNKKPPGGGAGLPSRGEIAIPTLATGAANPFEPLRKNIDGTLADIRKNTQKELGQALQGKVKFQTSAYQEWFNDFGGELESIQLQQQGGLLTGFQADVARLDFLTQALNDLKEQGLGAGNIKFDAVQAEIDKIGFGPKFLKNAQDAVNKIGEYVTPVVNQLGSIFSQIFANRSAELDAYYEKERANIEASAISEEAKANKIKALDEDVAKKKRALARKQAIADKAAAIFGAAVEGARAIISAFGKGPIYGAIVSALVAAQIAAIAATPLPSLAIGTDYVRQDGLAMLHKGEAVVPADVVGGGFSRGGMVNVSGRIQGTDILLVSDYAMDFKTRIR